MIQIHRKHFSWLAAACLATVAFVCHAGGGPALASAPTAAGTISSAKLAAPPTRQLDETEVRRLLTAVLNQQQGATNAEWELHFTRPRTPITVPDKPLTVKILEPDLSPISSYCFLRFELRADHEVLGSWQVPVQTHLWREIMVALSNLRIGETLSGADIGPERCDMLTVREPLYELPPDPGAYELGQGVSAGYPVPARAIRLKPVVFRGQIADAIVQDGAMKISLKVQVLEDGVPDQMVRVRNLQSLRELRGKVENEQTIAVSL